MFQALGMLPQMMQQSQLHNQQIEEQSSELDDKRLAQLAQAALSNPAFAQNPQVISQVKQIAKRRKLPEETYISPDGTLNLEAITPGKQFSQLTTAERTQFGQYEPGAARKAAMHGIRGVPDDFLSMKIDAPLSPGAETGLINQLGMAFRNVADPKGGGVQGFVAQIQMLKPLLAKMGMDTGSILSNPALQESLSQRADAEMASLASKGIKVENEAEYKRKYIEYLNGKLKNDVERTGIQSAAEKDRESRTAGQLQHWKDTNETTLKGLALREQGLKDKMTIAGQSLAGAKLLHQHTQQLQGDLARTQSAYDSLLNIAKGYSAAYQPVPEAINTQLGELKQKLDVLKPAAEEADKYAIEQIKSFQTGIVGHPTVPVKPAGGTTPAAPKQVTQDQVNAEAASFRKSNPKATDAEVRSHLEGFVKGSGGSPPPFPGR